MANSDPMAGLRGAAPSPEPEMAAPGGDPSQLIQEALALLQSGDPQAAQQIGEILTQALMMMGGGGGGMPPAPGGDY